MSRKVRLAREFDHYGASFERALQLNPNYADAMAEFAIRLAIRGDASRARRVLDTAVRLNPNTPAWYQWARITIGLCEQDYEMVITAVKELATPGVWVSHQAAMTAYVLMGRMDEAKQSLAELLRCFPAFAHDPRAHLRGLGLRDEDVDRRIECLRMAGLETADRA